MKDTHFGKDIHAEATGKIRIINGVKLYYSNEQERFVAIPPKVDDGYLKDMIEHKLSMDGVYNMISKIMSTHPPGTRISLSEEKLRNRHAEANRQYSRRRYYRFVKKY